MRSDRDLQRELERIDRRADALKVGDMVDVKLLDVDFDKKRISLSMKALLNDDAE